MKAVKRMEIILPSPALPDLLDLLERQQVPGYTLIRKVEGKGERGVQDGQGLTDTFRNSYVLVACDEAEIARLQEPLRKLLHRNSGVCLVSDAMWLEH